MFSICRQIQAGNGTLQDRADFFVHGSDLVLVLADGAGGITGGAEAAEFAIEAVKQGINSGSLNPEGLADLLSSIDRQMAGMGTVGETTCVVVVVSANGIAGASVGDSGAFVFSKTGADQLTAGQVRKPLLGSGHAVPVSFTRGPWSGTVLLASDGLVKYTSLEKISAVAGESDLETAAHHLVDLVRDQSGVLPDDVSILLARQL